MSEHTGDWAEDYRNDHRRRPPLSRHDQLLRRHGHAEAWAALVALVGWFLVTREAVVVDAGSTVAFLLLLTAVALAGRAVLFHLAVRRPEGGEDGPRP